MKGYMLLIDKGKNVLKIPCDTPYLYEVFKYAKKKSSVMHNNSKSELNKIISNYLNNVEPLKKESD